MSEIIFSIMDEKEEPSLALNMAVLYSGIASKIPPISVVTVMGRKTSMELYNKSPELIQYFVDTMYNHTPFIQLDTNKLNELTKLLDSQIDKTKIVPIFTTTTQTSMMGAWSLKSIKMAFNTVETDEVSDSYDYTASITVGMFPPLYQLQPLEETSRFWVSEALTNALDDFTEYAGEWYDTIYVYSHRYNTQPSDTDIVSILDDKYVKRSLLKSYYVKTAIHETNDSVSITDKTTNIPHTLVAYLIAVVVAKLTSDEFKNMGKEN